MKETESNVALCTLGEFQFISLFIIHFVMQIYEQKDIAQLLHQNKYLLKHKIGSSNTDCNRPINNLSDIEAIKRNYSCLD